MNVTVSVWKRMGFSIGVHTVAVTLPPTVESLKYTLTVQAQFLLDMDCGRRKSQVHQASEEGPWTSSEEEVILTITMKVIKQPALKNCMRDSGPSPSFRKTEKSTQIQDKKTLNTSRDCASTK